MPSRVHHSLTAPRMGSLSLRSSGLFHAWPSDTVEPTTTGFVQFLPQDHEDESGILRHAMHLAAQYQCFTH